MNLSDYLEQASDPGEMTGTGEFTISLESLLEKLSTYALEDDSLIPVVMISAANQISATHLNILDRPKKMTYYFDGPEPELSSLEGFQQCAVGRTFLTALAITAGGGRKVTLTSGRQSKRVSLDGFDLKFGDVSPNSKMLSVDIEGGSAFNLAVPLRHCGLSSVRWAHNGHSMQVPLSANYHRISQSVPPHLRGSGPTSLATTRAVAISGREEEDAIWVAVVNGASYTFQMGVSWSGIVWAPELKVDVGLRKLVQDQTWHELVAELKSLL